MHSLCSLTVAKGNKNSTMVLALLTHTHTHQHREYSVFVCVNLRRVFAAMQCRTRAELLKVKCNKIKWNAQNFTPTHTHTHSEWVSECFYLYLFIFMLLFTYKVAVQLQHREREQQLYSQLGAKSYYCTRFPWKPLTETAAAITATATVTETPDRNSLTQLGSSHIPFTNIHRPYSNK